jgi:hypothetical protein
MLPTIPPYSALRVWTAATALLLSPAPAHAAAGPVLTGPALPVQTSPRACLAGSYDGHQTEIAAGLDLADDGRFHYGLSYGALDEEAAGHWESDGANVVLTSDPVTPPRFTLERKGPGPAGQFVVRLELPRALSPQYFDARLTFADGRTRQSQLGEDGLVLPLKPGERVVSVMLLLSVYDLQSERFPIAAGAGTEAVFRFVPNDLGKVAFAHTALKIDKADLLLDRYGRQIRFQATRGGCPG